MNPNELVSFLGSLVDDADLRDRQVLLERSQTLVLKFSIPTVEVRTQLLNLTNEVPDYLEAISVEIDGTDIALSADHEIDASESYQITINKRGLDDQICLFFGQSIHTVEEMLGGCIFFKGCGLAR